MDGVNCSWYLLQLLPAEIGQSINDIIYALAKSSFLSKQVAEPLLDIVWLTVHAE